jgi:Lon protease (S16) C-terminal proteolytic domain
MDQKCLSGETIRRDDSGSQRVRRNWCPAIVWAVGLLSILTAQVSWGQTESVRRDQSIPILATTAGEYPMGAVVYVVVAFEERRDNFGLQMIFHTTSGRVSHLAQTSIQEAVVHTARALDLSPNSWTVSLIVPYPDVTIGGDSLSGMVALSIAILALGHPVPSHTVLTGTIRSDGSIAPVGAVPLRLAAAHAAHIRRVLVSDRQMEGETYLGPSSSLQLSPVRSVREALETILKVPQCQRHAGSFPTDMWAVNGSTTTGVVAQVLEEYTRGGASCCASLVSSTAFTRLADHGWMCERSGPH